jgi:hypothetical protein
MLALIRQLARARARARGVPQIRINRIACPSVLLTAQ